VNIYRRVKADPTDWFSADEVGKAKDYQRPLTVVRVVNGLLSLVVFLAIISTKTTVNVAHHGGSAWYTRLLLVLGFLLLVDTVIDLPFEIWTEFGHEKKWGFSTQTPARFVVDAIKGLVMSYVLFAALMLPVWWLIRRTDLWWIYGWAVFFLFTVVIAFLAPIVFLPMFNKFTPLHNESLGDKLRALARTAGLNISGVQVMDASKRTKKDNAFFIGLGKTRRVVLFDNLLTQPDTSIEAVVAHELGHWRRRHVVRLLTVGTVMSFALFYVLHLVTSWKPALRWMGVNSIKDPAALPLFLLVLVGGQLLLRYAQAWYARALERQADLEALDLTRDADAFTTMMKGLVTRNLSELAPSSLHYLRLDHPPPAERLEMAKLWDTGHEARTPAGWSEATPSERS
jgi:STE24 endopeptidase